MPVTVFHTFFPIEVIFLQWNETNNNYSFLISLLKEIRTKLVFQHRINFAPKNIFSLVFYFNNICQFAVCSSVFRLH